MSQLTTGILSLDCILGGGWPQGRCSELTGPPGSGCTTVALHTLAAAQRGDYSVELVTGRQHRHDRAYGLRLGADPFVMQARDHTGLIQYLSGALARSRRLDLIVVELGDEIDSIEALQALSKLLRHYCSRSRRTSLLFVTAGRVSSAALRYYCHARVQLQLEGETAAGDTLVTARVVKHKSLAPFAATALQLTPGDGVDLVKDLVRAAAAAGQLPSDNVDTLYAQLTHDTLARAALTSAVRRQLFLQGLPS